MNINFNPMKVFKISMVMLLLIFVGYMLGEITYKSTVIMLLTLLVALKA